MSGDSVVIEVNSNFHHVSGEDLFEKKSKSFREYRKKWKQWPENFHLGQFPLFTDIEVTSICNLRCPFCATTFRRDKIKRGFMSPSILRKIIDEGVDNNLYGVKFNIRGEPLLHPEIHEFVAYAKQKGLIDVYFNTNAMLMTKDVSKKLIEAGLDRLSVSFEGHTKDIYESHRVGAVYETVLSNIEDLQLLKEKLGVKHPRIRVQTIMLPELKDSFEEYKNFWSQRVDEVGYLDYKEMKVRKKGLEYPWACPQLWQRMGIWWDGTILPCNHDDEGGLSLGNVNEISIKQAWHSKKLNHIREIHKKGLSHQIPFCDGCYLRTSEVLKLMQRRTENDYFYPDGEKRKQRIPGQESLYDIG